MTITFTDPKEITLIKELKQTVSEITINEVIDNSAMKIVRAFTREVGVITLWEGDAYDAIGQWTDTDVINKINELYS
jgi:hypothetical protein